MFQPDPKLSVPKRCSSPFKPSSGCTVTTKEIVKEAELAIRTFQLHHDNVTVYVMADAESEDYLNSQFFDGPVIVFRRALTTPDVKKHNDYHRRDAIMLKMDVFQLAVNRSGDSVFFDADIIFLAPLSGPNDCEVALSHNLPCLPADHDGNLHGFFNAGLVWTCNKNYPNWWRDVYLANDGFYEQLGMNKTPRLFRTGYFDFRHNYGFWRGDIEQREIHSAHVHLSTALDKTMPKFMISCVKNMRRDVWHLLHRKHANIAQLARELCGHPEKVFFVHYGKASGVYINILMKTQIVPDYHIFDSWDQKMYRDWTTDELHRIINEAPEQSYLHQHHINVTIEDLQLAKARGWKTFMFLRQPIDVISSLYFWRRKIMKKDGSDPMFLPFDAEVSYQDFWYEMLKPDSRELWCLPPYIDLIDEVSLFSEDSFAALNIKWFGYPPVPKSKMNTSDNPGYAQLMDSGVITPQMLRDLQNLTEYQQFMRFLAK